MPFFLFKMEKDEVSALYTPTSGQQSPSITSNQATGGLNRYLVMICIASTVGAAIPVGYNIGVVNAPASYIQHWCNETIVNRFNILLSDGDIEILWSTIVSIFLIGGSIGSLGGAWVADKIGRKGSLLTCGILFIAGAILFLFCRLAESVEMLLIGRILVGLASGLTTTTAPMYLAEIAPLNLRGPLAVFCSMGVTSGVVFGQIASLQETFGTIEQWHIALSGFIILVVLCMLPYPWFPESPKYLYIIVKDKERARNELKLLRSNNFEQIENEMTLMETEANFQLQQRSLYSVIKDSTLLLPIILVCALQGGQQLSGINAVFYYSVSIFQSAGLSSLNAKWANLGAGCLNMFIACFSPMLMAKINRRPLILGSCFVSGICLMILMLVVKFINLYTWLPFTCIAAVFGYIFAYQMGLGPIPYFIGSELFESSTRPAAMALGSLSSWLCNFLIGMTFPLLQNIWGAYVFLLFAIVCFALTILLKIYLPETRGRHTSDIVPLVQNGFQSLPLLQR